ncbi:hypothetical protein FRC09_013176 [Ceratobasidium sp. 395]|nr:hypothetical protein FRC09_013176 [Ceratobasidium sp. 395]
MKAAEDFTNIDPFRNYSNTGTGIYPSQGTSGVIAAGYNNWYSDISTPYGETIYNVGIPPNFDPDSGNAFGLYNCAGSINRTTGKRSYAASTYYAYNAGRSNFVVLTGAQVTKINFANSTSGGNYVATSVSFVSNSATYTVKARKEVILSAGSVQTPQLLELSGIGNPSILQQYGIRSLVNLPGVGENLQDHLFVPTSYELKPGKTTFDILRNNATYAAQAQAQYANTHDGIYAAVHSAFSFIDLASYVNSNKISSMKAQLDTETASGTTPLQQAQYNIQKQWLSQKLGHLEIIMYPGLDLDSLVEAVKFGLTISQTEPLASAIVGRQDPAPGVTSDADIANYVKNNVESVYHPIGTAALAPRASGGVVGPNLKVYGTANVRVVDASMMPMHMATHITRTVYGIAEKAAAMIKAGQ